MNICRICLSGGLLKDIFDTYVDKSSNSKSRYVDIIKTCLDIQITAQITTTTKLCTKCVRKLVSFLKFKSVAIKNHEYLQTLHEDLVVKIEDISHDYEHVCEDDIKEETKDGLDIKIEDAVDSEVIDTAATAHTDTEDKDIIVAAKTDTADVDTANTADVNAADEDSDDELLSDVKKVKLETEEKVKTNQNGKTKKKKGRPPKQTKENKTDAPKRHVCVECGKVVKELRQHMLQHRPLAARKRYPCPQCDKTFSLRGSAKKHLKFTHLGIKSICPICNKGVRSLSQHTRVMHHRETLQHVCAVCDRRFLSRSALAEHMNTHTQNKSYECDLCSKRFSKKLSLQYHVRSFHNKEKTHLCQFCSKSFFQKNHLKTHLAKHSKEKPHECPDCGKFFKHRKSMTSHRLLHGGEKKYSCEICDMKFMKQEYLIPHMISHTKVKRHPCKYCGVKFGRSDHRKRHEFTAHQKHLLTSPT